MTSRNLHLLSCKSTRSADMRSTRSLIVTSPPSFVHLCLTTLHCRFTLTSGRRLYRWLEKPLRSSSAPNVIPWDSHINTAYRCWNNEDGSLALRSPCSAYQVLLLIPSFSWSLRLDFGSYRPTLVSRDETTGCGFEAKEYTCQCQSAIPSRRVEQGRGGAA